MDGLKNGHELVRDIYNTLEWEHLKILQMVSQVLPQQLDGHVIMLVLTSMP
jgi:hypothetical protein